MKRFSLTLALVLLLMGMTAGAHEIIKFNLKSRDKYYPGTEREIQVYVPDVYNNIYARDYLTTSDPRAALYVGLDGILCNAPNVMDSLIAADKMPVTIGVFIQPGVIKDNDGNVVRYNRSNEFDMTSDKFVSFLEEEVLPAVERLKTAKGVRIRLLRQDGIIFGLSSGGIAAFMAAWHRPDLFNHVFSGVGTFVAMRGGNDLQAIVRKSEPRPLRIFLQDGTNDVWNPLFGHWYEGNRMLASALDFAGYDARYDWSDCNHGVKRASEIFPEVMEWMWQGWEVPKCGKTQNNLLDTLLVEGSEWRQEPFQSVPGLPEAIYPSGKLKAFVHDGTNCLWQSVISDAGEQCAQPFYWLHSYDNSQLTISAMEFDAAGDLWVVTNAGIQICDQNGRVRGILMLPHGVDAAEINQIKIEDGEVALWSNKGVRYVRSFHVFGHKWNFPKSQGQG